MSELSHFRNEKDEFFRSHPQSPLTHEQRHNFDGLKYFDENPDLSLVVEVEEFSEKETIQMPTSTGDIQVYQRYGRFKFEVNGEEAELTIYSGEHGYFLQFADSQAGKETYGAGRYLEPEPMGGRKFQVDFNVAYNPYCAYNDMYSCPIPPRENRIKVAVKVGEKVYE